MKEILSDKLDNFSKALKKLEEAFAEEGHPLCLDGTIKRFEFSFEMSWKALKKFLLYEGTECLSARDCVKKAYQLGLIGEEGKWLNILKDKNSTSHIYDEKEAKDAYQRIKNVYFAEFKKLEEKLIEKVKSIE